MRTTFRIPHSSLFLPLLFISVAQLGAQSLNMFSGNGQMVSEQFISNAPMVVQAKDASGNAAANVAISWAITQGAGTLLNTTTSTDSSGKASTNFLATSLQPGLSFQAATVTASSSFGNVNFVITTVKSLGLSPPPAVQLLKPPLDNRSLTGASGSTLTGAVVVQVIAQAGAQAGAPVPNIGVRITNNGDPTSPAPAACRAPLGLVLTDSTGTATCDLVISGTPGTYSLTALAGETQFTPGFSLQITQGVSCTYSLSANSQSFGPSSATGSVNVFTSAGCSWTAVSNSNFLTINTGSSGTGNGTVTFTVGANSGAARSGTMTIAGQTYTVNQSAGNPSVLSIITPPTLPSAAIGSSYSVTLTASGGQQPYTWSATGVPPGLTLAASGILSGTPTAAGAFNFTATVKDNTGAQQSQNFSVTVNSSASGFTITNTAFPSGVIGQPYSQLLTTTGGCVTPFSPSPPFTLSGGSLPNGLIIQTNSDSSRSLAGTPTLAGAFNFTLLATDACGHTASANFSITIAGSASAPQLVVNPPSLTFAVEAGSTNIPADQTIAISSTSGTLSFNAVLNTSSGGTFLVARNATSGTTPGSLTVGVANFSGLAPGQYNGTITINSQASNNPVVVPVTLTVIASGNLIVSPNSFTVNQTSASGTTVTRQVISVMSSGAAIHFTAVVQNPSGASFLTVSPTQGDTPATIVATINAAGLGVGTYVGKISIAGPVGAPQIVTITLNVGPGATLQASPAPIAFNFQAGSANPPGQTLAVSSSGVPLSVTASVAQAGLTWLSINPTSGTTPFNITVSASPGSLQPGTYTGTITLLASDPTVAPLNVNVTLTVSTPPVISSITNAASFAPGPVSPGEFVVIFGSLMGPATLAPLQLDSSGKVGTALAGTQVFFDGNAAPVVYTSAGQLSAIVPYGVSGSAKVQISYQGVQSSPVQVRVIDSVPGIFTLDPSGQGAILNQDSSVNSSQNGANPGDVVSIYATGAGITTPASVDGEITGTTLPLPKPVLNVTVQIAGQQAEVLYAGAAPGLPAGILQVNARVPANTPRGTNASVVITVGVASSQPGVTMGIRP